MTVARTRAFPAPKLYPPFWYRLLWALASIGSFGFVLALLVIL